MANLWNNESDALEVRISELLVATADQGDQLIDASVSEVLQLLRQHMKMDVVFVSEFVDGKRIFRRVDAAPHARVITEGDSAPLEESYCQRIVDGRLPGLIRDMGQYPERDTLPAAPFPIGAHLSTPIVLKDGRVYGTLCCFSFAPNEELTQRDLRKLEVSAQLAAKRLDEKRQRANDEEMAKWSLQQTQKGPLDGP